MYTLLLVLIYLAFISLGLPDSLLGAGWPVMRQCFDVPISYMGFVSMIIAGGTICSSLLSERLTKKLSAQIVTVISVLLTALALFGFSVSDRFWMLCLFAVPYGLGAGAIDSALNNYVALHYSSRHMSWLHCFWGVGAIISPYVMSYAIATSAWTMGYRMISLIQMGIFVVLLITLPAWRVNKKPGEESKETKLLGLKGALKIKGVPTLLAAFFAYCSAEATTMLWTSSYLVGVKNLSEETAAAFGALWFIGVTVGRFISGFISNKLGDRTMIRLGFCVAFTGVILVMLPVSSPIVALVGLVIIGVGCGPIYPSIIHSTPFNFGAENSQGIIGIQMASAYTGSTFLPPIFGLIAKNISIGLFPYFIGLFFLLMIFMIERTFRTVDKAHAQEKA